MELGQKVRFQKELKRDSSAHKPESIQWAIGKGLTRRKSLEEYENLSLHSGYDKAIQWGVVDNGKVLEGVYCGKRNIDIDGRYDWEGGYEFGRKMTVYLIATNIMGFHRVPEDFIIKD
jgi:hypothetical protein